MIQETNSRELMLDGVSVVVRELTVLKVREWLRELSSTGAFDFVDEWLIEGCTMADVLRMTSLTREQIDSLRPSQLEEVVKVCKEQNPHFFALLARAQKLNTGLDKA